MLKKIVLMKNVKCNFEAIREEDEIHYYEDDSEYIVMSEVIEVDFPELDNEIIVKAQVAIIDKQITKINADAQAALTALEGRKADLLAICHDK